MAIEITEGFYINGRSDVQKALSTFPERKNAQARFQDVQNYIVNPALRGNASAESFASFLAGKKLWADTHVSKIEKTLQEYQNLASGKVVPSDVMNDPIYNSMMEKINVQAQLKYLQMYYDSYMAEVNSDMQWRLGNVKAVLKDPRLDDSMRGMMVNGHVFTRSNLSVQYDWEYQSQGMKFTTKKFYSSMGFPPYKHGIAQKINEPTQLMKEGEDYTFNLDNFSVKRENVTLRDTGMKAISDYINYLQWLIEGVTGIVSTYLTEWDLSLYIQEQIMKPKVNGGPMNIYLNFGIYNDNPLASVDNGMYTDDTALAFNVCGSAVSKLFYDCTKYWRPSDYPNSAWWMPYMNGRDFFLNKKQLGISGNELPYMSIYDDFEVQFNYEKQKDLMNILKHQDFFGWIAAAKPNPDLKFYEAFYSNYDDSLSNMDVKIKNLLGQVAGADPGKASAMGKDVAYLVNLGRREMLTNGGYYGGPTSVADTGGYMQRAFMQFELDNDSDEEMTTSKMAKAAAAGADDALMDNEPPSNNMATATDSAAKFIDTKKDAAVMAKMTGINRFSPAIYGGPHGSDYSPFNLRDYFKADSMISRDIPKVNPSSFTSGNSNMVKTASLEDAYSTNMQDTVNMSQSPTKTLDILKNGTYSYEKKLTYNVETVTRTFEADFVFVPDKNAYDFVFPETTDEGFEIKYDEVSPVKYKMKTFYVPDITKVSNDDRVPDKDFTVVGNYVIIQTPTKKGQVKAFVESVQRVYYINDMPNTKWKIVGHSFEQYSGFEGGAQSAMANSINSNRFGAWKYYKSVDQSKPAFTLLLSNPAEETYFMNEIVRYNRGVSDQPRYMYFFGRNAGNTGKSIDYIFKAPCHVRYYKNFTKIYTKFLWKKVCSGIQTTYMPFIYVDINNSTEYFDNLAEPPEEFAKTTSSEVMPLHMSQFTMSSRGYVTASPVQKMVKNYSHTIIAYESTVTESAGLFSGIGMLFGGGASAKGKYTNTGHGTPIWRSDAVMGIEGEGILSGWQGLSPGEADPYVVTPSNSSYAGHYTTLVNQGPYVKRPGANLENVSIVSLPLNYTSIANDISPSFTSEFDQVYKLDGGFVGQRYVSAKMPDFLTEAINKVCSRIIFYPYGQALPIVMKMGVPYEVFISYCLTQKNYLKIFSNIFDTFNFENIRKVLMNNVDNCVLKASGLRKYVDENDNVKYELVQPDPNHVLYNYWIDKAIQFFYNFDSHDYVKNRVKSEVINKISTIDNIVKKMEEYLKKDCTLWTYNDIIKMNDEISIAYETFVPVNIIDEVLFAYVNILYMYRLFFIGKRFNKEDGTMWIMRALESTIDLVSENNIDPPLYPSQMNDEDKNDLPVVFYEIQNSLDMKRSAVIDKNSKPLTVDRITKIYIMVEYGTKADFEAYQAWLKDKNNNPKARRMIQMRIDGSEVRYAFVPEDGMWQFRSKEYDDNYDKFVWNNHHKDKPAKPVLDFIESIFNIEWGLGNQQTPIRFNVFGSVDVNNLLQYSKDSISPRELVCLTEEGADFWTVTIPANVGPETTLFKKGLYIVKTDAETKTIYNDASYTVEGPFANSVYPIVEHQENFSSAMMANFQEDLGIPLP